MDKYYTPEESDLYVGYVCEVKEDKNWKPILVTWSDIFEDRFIYALEREEVRTKYLTQEDIESLGWELIPNYEHSFERGNYILTFQNEKIEIWVKDLALYDPTGETMNGTIFRGKAKSINELKKILEWVL